MQNAKTQGKKKASGVSIGMISLITFFTVLLLASFSILIVSSAQTDERLTQMTADAITAQYSADALAEQKLMELYKICESTDFDNLNAKLASSNFTVLSQENENIIVEYSIPIDDNKYFYVKISIPKDTDDGLKRLNWQLVSTTDTLA